MADLEFKQNTVLRIEQYIVIVIRLKKFISNDFSYKKKKNFFEINNPDCALSCQI
jgi:hypothetical protein